VRAAISIVVALAIIPAVFADPYPWPIARRAVSDPVFTAAILYQHAPKVATNGDIALAAWQDGRDQAIFAARVDAAGRILDPAGVEILNGGPFLQAVIWNGESFIIVMGRTLAFVTPDMHVTLRQVDLDGQYVFVAATTGSDVRLLYRGIDGKRGAILDRNGRVLTTKTITSTTAAGSYAAAVVGTDDGFFVLRSVQDTVNAGPYLVSERLSRDGNVISSVPAALPFRDGEMVIAGGADGFLVLRADTVLSAYHLTAEGVYTGKSHAIALHPSGVAVVRDDFRYLVAYHHDGVDSIAEIDTYGSVAIHDYPEPAGSGDGIAVTAYREERLLVTSIDRKIGSDDDIFIRRLTPSLDSPEASLLSSSAAWQSEPVLAAGANGFAVGWSEPGPDPHWHVYIRRFSERGVPQDEAPVLVYTNPSNDWYGTRLSMASNGETYLIAWGTSSGWVFRRLAARSGDWLDPWPVPIGLQSQLVLASNGTDAIAIGDGDSRLGERPTARRINLSGPPLMSPPIPVTPKGYSYAPLYDLAVASNGSDYLAVWVEGPGCVAPCAGIPTPLYAVRLCADGTPIDSVPLSLDGTKREQEDVAVVSAGGRWLVTWSCYACGTSSVRWRGTRVSAEGAVLDRDAEGGGVGLSNAEMLIPTAIKDRFGLLIRSSYYGFVGITFDPVTDLTSVAKGRSWMLLPASGEALQDVPVATVANGPFLGTVYRNYPAETGTVERVFLQISVDSPPRRRAAGTR
jgi:hypothetical protein